MKHVFELNSEKKVILSRIEEDRHSDVAIGGTAYNTVASMFAGSTTFLQNPENQQKMLAIADEVQHYTEQMRYSLDVLSLYKASCIEHAKMQASPTVPQEIKRVSALNIHLYEEAMREHGITDEMMRDALTHDDYDERIRQNCIEQMTAATEKFAEENTLQVSAIATPDVVTKRILWHSKPAPGKDSADMRLPNFEQAGSTMYGSTYGRLASSGLPYFQGIGSTWRVNVKYNAEPYKFFTMKDGKYVERPYPNGFFAKIGYFFTKLSHRADIAREASRIASDLEDEKTAFAEQDEHILEQPTVADLSSTVVGVAKTQQAAAQEQALDAVFTEQVGRDSMTEEKVADNDLAFTETNPALAQEPSTGK